jgi:Crinkler effector protein N-terminal domain
MKTPALLTIVVNNSTAMATIRVLHGIVPDDEVFKVEVDTSNSIMDLKRFIHKDSTNAAHQVRPQRLTLWKIITLTMSAST